MMRSYGIAVKGENLQLRGLRFEYLMKCKQRIEVNVAISLTQRWL